MLGCLAQHIACWPAAIVSASLYVWLFYRAGLYMESGLQFFYIAMAIYGWLQWAQGAADGQGKLPITRMSPSGHGLSMAAIIVLD